LNKKKILKARGYRWDGKVWWADVAEGVQEGRIRVAASGGLSAAGSANPGEAHYRYRSLFGTLLSTNAQ
jgi:hypothetical protein